MSNVVRVSKEDYDFIAKTAGSTNLSYSTIVKLALAEWRSSKSYSKLMLNL